MKEIYVGHGKYALIDDEDYDCVSQYNWILKIDSRYKDKFYAEAWIDGKMVSLHRFIMDFQHPKYDHINGDGLNCQKHNLRPATNQENSANSKKQKNCSSQFKGVHWDINTNTWRARIRVNGTLLGLGRFDDEKEAARAYDKAAKRYFGEFARLNFPDT